MGFLQKIFGSYSDREIKRIMPLQQQVLDLEEKYAAFSDEQLRGMTEKFKAQLKEGKPLDAILPDAFAVCREAGWRVLSMKHFPVQILGGIVLHQGRISEMRTGEGKTLVATLPAYLNALTGKGVHIVTVNDYLARRDSEWMGKLYKFLGLTVGLIVPGMEPDAKKEAYDADITYCTNNELGFDYLRDNMAIFKEARMQRGYNFAIVDEVDSILIDEARTPLIISGQGEKSSELYQKANALARRLQCVRVKDSNEKNATKDLEETCDYIVDEKAKTATLTERGVKKTEAHFNISNLNDSENSNILHHIKQAIRAYGVMRRDIDYVVRNGEVLIVDEFTGRIMYGRRYNEGLHQAIEAKEGVSVADEAKTLATITFQNFFRLYSKLSGMTGTAMTEEEEFRQIYRLDVVEIPTNKPVIRVDMEDSIYQTEKVKFDAVVQNVKQCYEKGQPVLVGTVSIEKSEQLSVLLKRNKIPHNVLNAKHHDKEAEIIAQAGKLGAVTIATNMAGRGTDIMLGGNAEYLAKSEMRKQGYSEEMISAATSYFETDDRDIIHARELYSELYSQYKDEIAPEAEAVRKAGGLFIIGTERHESRRIDNQLRGRAGRQGDPGASRFFVSAEDDVARLFAGEKLQTLLAAFKVGDENMPVEAGAMTRIIETAQQKLESRNFEVRRNVLQFDDVMNKQREIIYAQRNRVLEGEDIKNTVVKMIDDTIDAIFDKWLEGDIPENWKLDEFGEALNGWICDKKELKSATADLNRFDKYDFSEQLKEKAHNIQAQKESEFGEAVMREAERTALLISVDQHWMDHIDAMDDLRQGVSLRAYGQKDPISEYRNEGFAMFDQMTDLIRASTAKKVLTLEKREERRKVAEESSTEKNTTVRGKGVVSKNALCPCGSGKKYKRCCGKGID